MCLLTFLAVEFSQRLLRQGDEFVIVGLVCQVARFLEILPSFIYSTQFVLRVPPIGIDSGVV